jgi:hypothetical protein
MPTECEAAKTVFMLWLLSLPADQRTKPILCVVGTVGSGKTRAVVGACQFYGMTPRINALTEKGEDEFWNSANTGGIYGLDNADTKTKWLVDALAAASTGGTREKRKLYTDSDVIIQRARAAVAVTSSNPSFGSDSGLADRLLVVRLHRIDMQTAESAITDEILAARDAGLSWVAHTLSKALADTAPTPDGLNRRHPDFADLAVRIARALDIETEAIDALRWAEKDKSLFNLEHSDVGQGLLAVIKPETPFSGTAAALLELLRESDEYFNGNYWNAKRMGRKLSAIWPHIKTVFNRAVMHDARGGKLYEIYA